MRTRRHGRGGGELSRRRGRPGAGDEPGPSSEAILEVALAAFGEAGFAGTSVRDIARRVGVSHTLLAHRFGSKEELWTASVDHGFQAVALTMWGLVADPPEDDVDRLRAIVVGFISATATRPALLRIINQEAAAGGPRFEHLLDRYIGPVRDLGAQALASLHESGRVRPTSVGLLYFLMTHGAGGPLAFPHLAEELGEAVDTSDPEAVRRFAEGAADVIFRGIVY